MRPVPVSSLALLGTLVASRLAAPHMMLHAPPTVVPNPNTDRAGTLHAGVLSITLEASESLWEIDGPGRPPTLIPAFSEPGKSPRIPGPLVRVNTGTDIQFSVRNTLATPLTFFIPAAIRGGPTGRAAVDSVVIAPGAVERLTTRATAPGNYFYRAMTLGQSARQGRVEGLLAGAIVVDTMSVGSPPPDRIFVILATMDSVLRREADDHIVNLNAPAKGHLVFTINGRSWPNTERIHATVGDSLHWRIINASADNHPMHLHGFYYRVDAFADLAADSGAAGTGDAPSRMVVTQLLPPLSTMSISWSPDRPGNWIFHCHFALHLMPDSASAAMDDPHRRGMVGLVLGVSVAERRGVRAARAPVASRRLRLVAMSDTATGSPRAAEAFPSMRFVLEEHGKRVEAGPGFSPTIDLTRGEPVSITVVNHLTEPTSVHWHGIELEDSYVDGVPGVSGAGSRLAPAIAPGDSFEARFTPPRSGTFMYHAHVNEVWQQLAGLEGALIVREPGSGASPDDHVFFLKGSRAIPRSLVGDAVQPMEIDGQANPDTIVLHVRRAARFRVLSLAAANPQPRVSLTRRADSTFRLRRDTMLVLWRPVAKDGFELPASAQQPRVALQPVSMGETYDFEYVPERRETLLFEVRVSARFGGTLLARVPIRVE